MEKINIAIVGCGAISYVTFPGYLKHPSSEIYALCDPLPERARSAARSIGIDPIIYSELKKNNKDRKIPMVQIMREEGLKAFKIWDKKTDKIKY